ncbi:MAG TPA: nucleotidyltransferase family protein [Terriglobales bacterium]|nr:nucleotidyltransferase family protein [Terriglobales bacterium]
MKAFLLAAGHGTRLRPLTDSTPKCLLPVQGIPMLEIWLAICRKYHIHEVLINVHAHARAVAEYLESHRNGVHVRIVEEQRLLGSAGTLVANREWVDSEECFWVFYGDVLTSANLSAMLRLHQSRNPAATLGVYRVSDPRRCGIVTLAPDGTVTDFVEKPSQPVSDLAFAGVMVGTPALLDAVPAQPVCDVGFDVLPRLAGQMLAYNITDYLIDIGTMQNYAAAQSTWPGLS